jgi:uncharacterized delta-60 repeat protein
MRCVDFFRRAGLTAYVIGLLLTLMSPVRPALAQNAENGFDPNANGDVLALAVEPDGNILVGGTFTTIGGQARNHIARLKPDGSLDSDFDPNADNSVTALAVQTDGKILVAGAFATIGGQTQNYLARLNANGSVDTMFNPAVHDNPVYVLALNSDTSQIVVGGGFSGITDYLGHTTGQYIASLYAADGRDDLLYDSVNPQATVYELVMQPDGGLVVGGSFGYIGGQSESYIARLDAAGNVDTTFNPNPDRTVYALALQPDGKVLVGGAFATIGGQTRNYIARLDANGSADPAFDPNADNGVYAMALQTDGKLTIGGLFATIGGQTRKHIARLNADGSVDAAYDPNADNNVLALALQPDGKLLVGGQFTTIGGQARNHIARLSATQPAAQSFSVIAYDNGASLVTWTPSGAWPELILAPQLLYSQDEVTWNSIATGQRYSGGWRFVFGQLPLNQAFYLEVQGLVPSGKANGSSGLIESTAEQMYVSSNDGIFTDSFE